MILILASLLFVFAIGYLLGHSAGKNVAYGALDLADRVSFDILVAMKCVTDLWMNGQSCTRKFEKAMNGIALTLNKHLTIIGRESPNTEGQEVGKQEAV